MIAEELRTRVGELMPQAKGDLAALVAFRSVADAEQYPPEECKRPAQWLVDAFAAAGLEDVAAHGRPMAARR